MSIPLDRLYHYIESIAQDVYGDILIYRFSPDGSKKIEDLRLLKCPSEPWVANILPEIYCYDQEPLNYALYQDQIMLDPAFGDNEVEYQLFVENNAPLLMHNIRNRPGNVYDLCLLLHSEKNSPQVNVYRQMNFIPVYYWSHALIALDWFRYARHVELKKQSKKTFLVYNRAWSGTREYRLRFAELLVQLNLQDACQTSINTVEPELGIHYDCHKFKNPVWHPQTALEDYFPINTTPSHYSADFDVDDYNATDIEVVLETLFDDARLHLTEKSLRPIALAQPFVLAATAGSLEYLRSYGFKTFSSVWDESYDAVKDPEQRLYAITNLMAQINNWELPTRERKLAEAQVIANYNQQHFFSQEFFNQVTNELTANLTTALAKVQGTRNLQAWVDRWNTYLSDPDLVKYITSTTSFTSPNLTAINNIKNLNKPQT